MKAGTRVEERDCLWRLVQTGEAGAHGVLDPGEDGTEEVDLARQGFHIECLQPDQPAIERTGLVRHSLRQTFVERRVRPCGEHLGE